MNSRICKTLAGATLLSLLCAANSEAQTPARETLATSIQKLFSDRCGACHKAGAAEEETPHLVDDLSLLNKAEYINVSHPEDSLLYSQVVNGKMPRTTKVERKNGEKAQPLTPDETQLVLAWIKEGLPTAPSTAAAPPTAKPLEGPSRALEKTEAPTVSGAVETRSNRICVTEAAVLSAALKDLLELKEEDREDIRYLSLHPQHNNNTDVTDADLTLMRGGVSKLLNSLSTNPKIATFGKIGPEGVLIRLRLRDLGWNAALWNKITSDYPYAVDSGSFSALAGPARCPVPLVRADWFAATASRPPAYDLILNHPKSARDLERKLGIDIPGNLAAGDALRSAFTPSGVSKQNRLVERHEIRAYAGYYWKSYDFKVNTGRGRIVDFPLGPFSANLFGGVHAFEHAGGEIIYSLPNGMQAYMLVASKDEVIDIGPVDIVSDRFDRTGRAQIVNGFSCIACHDRGIKELPADEVRPVANSPKFKAEEQRLIERLHPSQERINAAVKEDTTRFQNVLASAGLDANPRREPVLAIIDQFEKDVTLAQAAAEIGVNTDHLSKLLEGNAALFDTRSALRAAGIPRVAFLDHFSQMVVRLGLGAPRGSGHSSIVTSHILDHAGVRSDRAANQLAVELRANKTKYFKGDSMLFTVETSEDAYVRLLYQDAEGNVKVLLPNAAHDGKIKGNTPIVFGDEKLVNPITGKAFRIRCAPPFGSEMIAAVVSNTPFADTEIIRQKASASKGGLATGSRVGKGAEVEIVETVRARTQDARVGVARLSLTTAE